MDFVSEKDLQAQPPVTGYLHGRLLQIVHDQQGNMPSVGSLVCIECASISGQRVIGPRIRLRQGTTLEIIVEIPNNNCVSCPGSIIGGTRPITLEQA